MKNLLLSFEDFITGIGIWILVGCLAFCLVVSVIFLLLNLKKEKKEKESENRRFAESIAIVQKQEAENKEAAKEAKAEEKPVAKKTATKKPAEAKKETKVVKEVAEEKPAAKKPVAKKTETKAPAKKPVEANKPAEKKEVEETPEEALANYEIVFDFDANEWIVRKENSTRATKRTRTKQEAIDYAKPIADKNGVKLIVHNKND